MSRSTLLLSSSEFAFGATIDRTFCTGLKIAPPSVFHPAAKYSSTAGMIRSTPRVTKRLAVCMGLIRKMNASTITMSTYAMRRSFKRMDEISLQQPEKFAAVVAGHTNIRHLFFGHLHRPIGGSWRGIPMTTMRATCHQVALDFVMQGVVPGSHEPPAYAVVMAEADLTVVHFHDYLDKTNTFVL